MGSELSEFEREYAAFTGCEYCLGVASGYDALVISLHVMGIGEGDEVIVPSHTYIASWLAISHVGATIVPVEVDQATLLLDIDKTKKAITKRTRAIMPVHLYGQSCDMVTLRKLAGEFGLAIVEDNAQAQGAKFDGTHTGNFGDCNATSFYPTKNLGALGDGGAITTNNLQLYEKAVRFRNYGSKEQFVNPIKGVNSRLDEMQAAVLRIKLRHLTDWNQQRRRIAGFYHSSLKGVGDLIFQTEIENSYGVYHQFVIRTGQRDELRSYLFQRGIGTMIHYPIPPHLQGAFSEMNYHKGDFPVTEEIAKHVVSIPVWPALSTVQQEWVVTSIKEFYK